MQLKTNSFPKSKLKRWIKPILIFGVSLIGIGGVVILIALLSFGKSPSDAPGIFSGVLDLWSVDFV